MVVVAVFEEEAVSNKGDPALLSVSSLDWNQKERRERLLPEVTLEAEVVSEAETDAVVSRERGGAPTQSRAELLRGSMV